MQDSRAYKLMSVHFVKDHKVKPSDVFPLLTDYAEDEETELDDEMVFHSVAATFSSPNQPLNKPFIQKD